mmetsp:Transcript_33446/g.70387  ORF Transcript_33446/g.70387 Transcript_33446/m.70387 type:complete len:241 (-) Transcript_33446:206-928(-)
MWGVHMQESAVVHRQIATAGAGARLRAVLGFAKRGCLDCCRHACRLLLHGEREGICYGHAVEAGVVPFERALQKAALAPRPVRCWHRAVQRKGIARLEHVRARMRLRVRVLVVLVALAVVARAVVDLGLVGRVLGRPPRSARAADWTARRLLARLGRTLAHRDGFANRAVPSLRLKVPDPLPKLARLDSRIPCTCWLNSVRHGSLKRFTHDLHFKGSIISRPFLHQRLLRACHHGKSCLQ